MKLLLVQLTTIIFAVFLVSYSNGQENKKTFSCTWFIYDNPSDGTEDFDDYPNTLTEATTVGNYIRFEGELSQLCAGYEEICAICADDDTNGDPILTPGSTIYDSHLAPYFAQPNKALRSPNPSFIREKNTF